MARDDDDLLLKGSSHSFFQKQRPRGVPSKRCSENMQQIFKRAPMPKCMFFYFLYITSENFKNIIVFQVTFKLVVEWGREMISLCSSFFGVSW